MMEIIVLTLLLVVVAARMRYVRKKKQAHMKENTDSNTSVNESHQQSEEYFQEPAAHEPAFAPVVVAANDGPFAAQDWHFYEMPTYLRRAARPLAA